MKKQISKWGSALLTTVLVLTMVLGMLPLGQLAVSAEEQPPAGQLVVVIEKFTLGQGYLVEPQWVNFYPGDTLSHVVSRVLGTGKFRTGSHGVDMGEYGKGFSYLSSIYDPEPGPLDPPQAIQETAFWESRHDRQKPDWLGEFDYTNSSGWMYTASAAGSSGLGSNTPHNAEVLRLVFTVSMAFNPFTGTGGNVSRDALARRLAYINSAANKAELLAAPGVQAAYDQANTVYCDLTRTQTDMDEALAGLNAVLPSADHHITYDLNGGTGEAVDPTAYATGTVATLLSEHGLNHPDDKFLTSWNTRPDGSGDAYLPGASITMDKDIRLYAIWNYEYSVTYDVNAKNGGGNATAPVDTALYFPGRSVTLKSISGSKQEPEMVFKEWNTKPDGSGVSYQKGAKITMPAQDLTLYAIWNEGRRVLYDGNGYTRGTVPSASSYQLPGTSVYASNMKNNIKSTLWKDDQRIASWNTKPDGTGTSYAFNQQFTLGDEDIVLYAIYSAAYKVSYAKNDGSGEYLETDEIKDYYLPGAVLDYKSLSKGDLNPPEGTSFKEWNSKPDGTGASYKGYVVGQEPVTFYAIYQPVYSIHFEVDGGEGSIPKADPAPAGQGTYISHIGTLTKNGLAQKEWNTRPDGTGTAYRCTGTVLVGMEEGGTTLYAIYYTAAYTVTYDLNGGVTGLPTAMTGCYPGTTVILKGANNANLNRNNGVVLPTGQPGMVFKGWATDKNATTGAETVTMPDHHLTVYAVWVPGLSVTYDLNGGSGTTPVDEKWYNGNRETRISTARSNDIVAPEGTVFKEWNTRADGTGTAVRAGASVTTTSVAKETDTHVTLYAIYKAQYVVKYDLNGGSGNISDSAKTFSGNSVTLSKTKPTKDGVTFKRWNTKPDGTGADYQPGDKITLIDRDITLYARWSKNRVLYDLNGGSGTTPVDSGLYAPNSAVTAAGIADLIPPEGYRLVGWNTKADGSGEYVIPGETFRIGKSEMTLYAIWQTETSISQELDKHLAALLRTVPEPTVGSVGGEWAVLALARAGYTVPDMYVANYYANAVQYIRQHINEKGQLDASKATDNARLILALTAIGKDVTHVAGHNLLTALSDLDYLKNQGINGPVWALIALNAHQYAIPTLRGSGTQATRENILASILDMQLKDGGWTFFGEEPDPDMTGMALQALAPYYKTNAAVQTAVDKALARLSAMQLANGGFSSWGSANSESTAQVITALTALGIDPTTDARFVKANGNPVSALLTFALEDGGFKHTLDESGLNGMATEQDVYALVAYARFLNRKTSLYDMSDVELHTEPDAPNPEEKYVTLADVNGSGVTVTGKESLLTGKELEANFLTSGDRYTQAEKALKDGKLTLYDLYLLENNLEVQPTGTVSLSLPVPAGYDAAQCLVYRIHTDGSITAVTAALRDGKLVFETNQMGVFALYQPTNAGGNNSGTAAPSTGDTTPVTAWCMVSLCMLAALAVTTKRKLSKIHKQ